MGEAVPPGPGPRDTREGWRHGEEAQGGLGPRQAGTSRPGDSAPTWRVSWASGISTWVAGMCRAHLTADPLFPQLPTAPWLPGASQVTIYLTLRPLLPRAPAQHSQRPLRPVPGPGGHRQCQLWPGRGGAGTSWPAAAAQRVRTVWAHLGPPRRGLGTLLQHSEPGPACLTMSTIGRWQQLARQPTGKPFEEWAVPRAAAPSLAHLGARVRPPLPRQR